LCMRGYAGADGSKERNIAKECSHCSWNCDC
jgi:hypothetical protein